MSKKLSGILTIVAGLIGFVAFYFFVRIMMEGDEAIEAMLADETISDNIVSPFISFAKFVLIATTLIAVVFSFINLIKHPDVLKRSLLGVGVMVVILVIAYSFADDGAVTDGVGKILPDGEAGSISKWVSTLINYSFILGGIGLAMVGVDFVKGLVK